MIIEIYNIMCPVLLSLIAMWLCQNTYNDYRNLQYHVSSFDIIECHVTMSVTYNDCRNLQ